jgi:hypothetical protein
MRPPRYVLPVLGLLLFGNGNYTAILRGASNGTGVGLLEVYNLR